MTVYEKIESCGYCQVPLFVNAHRMGNQCPVFVGQVAHKLGHTDTAA